MIVAFGQSGAWFMIPVIVLFVVLSVTSVRFLIEPGDDGTAP